MHYLGNISLNVINKKKFLYCFKKFKKIKNYGYIQIFYLTSIFFHFKHWFFYNDSVCFINKYSIERKSKKRFEVRLGNEIKSYISTIKKFYSYNQLLYHKIANLIFAKNIRPWIMDSVLNNGNKNTIKILHKNNSYLSDIKNFNYLKILLKLFPQFIWDLIIPIKRKIF